MLMYGYPEIFKEIFKNFPTLALKTISWGDFIRESGAVYRNYLKNEIPKDLLINLERIKPSEINIVREKKGSQILDGEILLKLYFSQLKNKEGIIIDLRSQHFDSKNFKPPAFWYQFGEDFLASIISLYRGFYYDNDEQFRNSLSELGMTKNLGKDSEDQLVKLFKNHFGHNTQAVSFKLETFNQSFLEIFKFFMQNKVKLPVDFIFLGAYLTTLYSHLEKSLKAYDVESIFKSVFPKASS